MGNARAYCDSDLGSPVLSVESYGDLSDIYPPPSSNGYDSDCDDGDVHCNISDDDSNIDCFELVEPRCGSSEEKSLYDDSSDSNPQRARLYDDCSYDKYVLCEDDESDASGEIQLDCGMSVDPSLSSRLCQLMKESEELPPPPPLNERMHIDPSNKSDRVHFKDPLIRFRYWKSERIDPPEQNAAANSSMHQFFVILEIFALRCAFDHLRQANNNAKEEVAPCAIERLDCNVDQRRNQGLLVRRRVLEKALQSWRGITATSMKLRQKYFLMMIVNRWRIYVDECIDLRQKRYAALLHWATVRFKKSFAVLKSHAKQSKEEKKFKYVGLRNEKEISGIGHSLRLVTPAMLHSKSKYSSISSSGRNSAGSDHWLRASSVHRANSDAPVPSVSMAVPKSLPDYRISSSGNWLDDTRSAFLQCRSKQLSPSFLQTDFHAQTAQLPRPTIASTKYSVGMPSPFLSSLVSNDRHAYVMAGSRQRFGGNSMVLDHGIDQPTSWHFSSVLGPTSQHRRAAAQFLFCQVGSYQERFITASVLDGMISIVERRHSTDAARAGEK
jgi:hypothetical protein